MADIRKLRARLKPLLHSVGGATVLVAGLTASCGIETTSGNLLPADVQQVDTGNDGDTFTSGNLLPADTQEFVDTSKSDAGGTDAGGATDAGVSDSGVPDSGMTDSGMTDAGTTDANAADTNSPDWGTTGNLLPPDIFEVKDAGESHDTGKK